MLNELAKKIHQNAKDKGFYDSEINLGEKLCLIHSEVTEALGADQRDLYVKEEAGDLTLLNEVLDESFFRYQFETGFKNTFEDEMADIIIRTLDMCAFKGIDIEAHVIAKMRYNAMRERLHGKKY